MTPIAKILFDQPNRSRTDFPQTLTIRVKDESEKAIVTAWFAECVVNGMTKQPDLPKPPQASGPVVTGAGKGRIRG